MLDLNARLVVIGQSVPIVGRLVGLNEKILLFAVIADGSPSSEKRKSPLLRNWISGLKYAIWVMFSVTVNRI